VRPVVSTGAVAVVEAPVEVAAPVEVVEAAVEAAEVVEPVVVRKKWAPKVATKVPEVVEATAAMEPETPSAPLAEGEAAPARKKWEPKKSGKDREGGA
jgi:hypothetical protein